MSTRAFACDSHSGELSACLWLVVPILGKVEEKGFLSARQGDAPAKQDCETAMTRNESGGRRLKLMVPLGPALILILLFLNFREVRPVLLILVTIPLAMVGVRPIAVDARPLYRPIRIAHP
jgi:hypothetical protein